MRSFHCYQWFNFQVLNEYEIQLSEDKNETDKSEVLSYFAMCFLFFWWSILKVEGKLVEVEDKLTIQKISWGFGKYLFWYFSILISLKNL